MLHSLWSRDNVEIDGVKNKNILTRIVTFLTFMWKLKYFSLGYNPLILTLIFTFNF